MWIKSAEVCMLKRMENPYLLINVDEFLPILSIKFQFNIIFVFIRFVKDAEGG